MGGGRAGDGTITETEKGEGKEKDVKWDQHLTQGQSSFTVIVITIITFNTFTKTI